MKEVFIFFHCLSLDNQTCQYFIPALLSCLPESGHGWCPAGIQGTENLNCHTLNWPVYHCSKLNVRPVTSVEEPISSPVLLELEGSTPTGLLRWSDLSRFSVEIIYYAPIEHRVRRGHYKMGAVVCPSVCRMPRPNSRTEGLIIEA